MSFTSVYVNPNGRTARNAYVGALAVLLAAVAFYVVLVKGLTAEWCLVVLLFPAMVLHARRLHDMGKTAWFLVLPGALLAALMWLRISGQEAQYKSPVTLAALAVSAAFILWSLLGKGQAESNRFGESVTA